MNEHKKFIIRCRAIILHEGKLLVVKHAVDATYVALPGGHMEWGEDVRDCLSREIMEELGVTPTIGRLLYVNRFEGKEDTPSVEFFFEVTNGGDYGTSEQLERSHAHEIAEILWASPTDNIVLLPQQVGEDFKKGWILSDEVRYLTSIVMP